MPGLDGKKYTATIAATGGGSLSCQTPFVFLCPLQSVNPPQDPPAIRLLPELSPNVHCEISKPFSPSSGNTLSLFCPAWPQPGQRVVPDGPIWLVFGVLQPVKLSYRILYTLVLHPEYLPLWALFWYD